MQSYGKKWMVLRNLGILTEFHNFGLWVWGHRTYRTRQRGLCGPATRGLVGGVGGPMAAHALRGYIVDCPKGQFRADALGFLGVCGAVPAFLN